MVELKANINSDVMTQDSLVSVPLNTEYTRGLLIFEDSNSKINQTSVNPYS